MNKFLDKIKVFKKKKKPRNWIGPGILNFQRSGRGGAAKETEKEWPVKEKQQESDALGGQGKSVLQK